MKKPRNRKVNFIFTTYLVCVVILGNTLASYLPVYAISKIGVTEEAVVSENSIISQNTLVCESNSVESNTISIYKEQNTTDNSGGGALADKMDKWEGTNDGGHNADGTCYKDSLLKLPIQNMPTYDEVNDDYITSDGSWTYKQSFARNVLFPAIETARTNQDNHWYSLPNGLTVDGRNYIDHRNDLTWGDELESYSYDLELERVAMQRVLEMYIHDMHTTPYGDSFSYTYLYMNSPYVNCKNIEELVGMEITTDEDTEEMIATRIVSMFMEEGKEWDGQGHRRVLLGVGYDTSVMAEIRNTPNFDRIGIGCMKTSDGTYHVAIALAEGEYDKSYTDSKYGYRNLYGTLNCDISAEYNKDDTIPNLAPGCKVPYFNNQSLTIYKLKKLVWDNSGTTLPLRTGYQEGVDGTDGSCGVLDAYGASICIKPGNKVTAFEMVGEDTIHLDVGEEYDITDKWFGPKDLALVKGKDERYPITWVSENSDVISVYTDANGRIKVKAVAYDPANAGTVNVKNVANEYFCEQQFNHPFIVDQPYTPTDPNPTVPANPTEPLTPTTPGNTDTDNTDTATEEQGKDITVTQQSTGNNVATISVSSEIENGVIVYQADLKKKTQKVKLSAKSGSGNPISYKVVSYPSGGKKYVSVSKNGVVSFKKGAPAGTYKIRLTSSMAKIKYVTIKVTGKAKITVAEKYRKTVTYKVKNLKKKSYTLSLKGKSSNGKKVKYKVYKYPKNAKKYIKVSSSGKVTLKKGAKKGTYKIKVYASGAVTQYVTIKVK